MSATDKLQRVLERLASETTETGRQAQAALNELAKRGGPEWTRLLRYVGADERRRADGSVEVSYRADGQPIERRTLTLEKLPHGALCVLALELLGDRLRSHEAAWRERYGWLLERVHEYEELSARLRVREGHLQASLVRAQVARDSRGQALTHEARQDIERLDHAVKRIESDIERMRWDLHKAETDRSQTWQRATEALRCYELALRDEPVPGLDYWTISSDELRAMLRPVLRELQGSVAEQLALWTAVHQHATNRNLPERDDAREQVALWAKYAQES